MPTTDAQRPDPAEYADYYGRYITLVPAGPVLETLERQLGRTLKLAAEIGEEMANHRYAPEKWSIKEVLGHVLDVERVFAYRALRFARGDATPIPGIEQDDYVRGAAFDRRKFASITGEFDALRRSNLLLFESFDEEVLMRRGTASDCPFTVRSLLWILAGHELHHLRVIQERYL